MNTSQNYIKKLCAEYLELHCKERELDLLIGENNIEKRDIKGYHGREILELLQNADDAYEDKKNKEGKQGEGVTVLIKFFENKLTVSNSGTTFDENGIKAIVQGNNSSKEKGKYIGNKGTGFRSILNWATKVEIYSGEFNILFSKDIAKKELNKIKHLPQISKQVNKSPDLYIPMLSLPQCIDKINTGYDTSIIIDINKDSLNDGFGVIEQIENIDLRILLFLPNIYKIIIELENRKIEYERIFDSSNNFNEARLIKRLNGYVQSSELFYVFKKKIENITIDDDIKNNILLSIAVPKDFRNYDFSNIYTFFPLKDTESPFRCVLHASFELGDNRNNISYNTTNKIIIENLMHFLKDVSFEFIKYNYGDVALKLLIPINFTTYNWKFPVPFSHFNLETFYLNLMKDINFLQTVNDEYISISDNPKIFNSWHPKNFSGPKFSKLIRTFSKELKDINAYEFINFVADKFNICVSYDEYELLGIVNSFTEELTPEEHVEIFCWWNNTYKKSLPNLLRKQDKTWINFKDECYLLEGDVSSDIPTWVNVSSISPFYQDSLLDYINKNEKDDKDISVSMVRRICQNKKFPLVNFSYRDRTTILRTVNSSVDSYEKSIDFIKWLWINYADDIEWTPPKESNSRYPNYNFPNFKNKKTCSSYELYLGSAYGNFLAESLFAVNYGELPPSEFFISKNDSINDFINFICKFGVRKYPRIESQEITPVTSYKNIYIDDIKNDRSLQLGASIFVSEIIFTLPYIKNLEYILSNLQTKEIIRWINNDSELRTYLFSKYYIQGASLSFRGNRQKNSKKYNKPILNYILFLFNNIKWVEINKVKFSPNELLSEFLSRNNLLFSKLLPVLTNESIENTAQELELYFSEVEYIFKKFDFCENPTFMSSENFYSFMLKLQSEEIISSSKMSKSLYRIIEKNDFSRKFEHSESKDNFFNYGKVLVKKEGRIQYYKASEAILPSSKIVNKSSFPIVEKGLRTNNKNFVDIFGCQEYNNSYEIINDSIVKSDADLKFQNYYSNFKKFALAYREMNFNIDKYAPLLKITLVKSIVMKEGDTALVIHDEYTTIRDTNTQWYIVVSSKEFDINKISLEIEAIYSNIASTQGFDEGKIGELFRAENNTIREFLIEKEFGTLDVIDDTFYRNGIKSNFINTVKLIDNSYNINEIDIDFDDFDSIKNCKNIILILSMLGVDIDEFISKGFSYPIDLRQYYKQQLNDYILHERENFKNYIFTNALVNIGKQEIFLNLCDDFNNFEIETYVNSIYFDIKKIVFEKFGFWSTENVQNAHISYRLNYDFFNPENLFSDDIANNTSVQTMIYFNRKSDFELWLSFQKDIFKQNSIITEDNDKYEGLRDVIPKKVNVTFSDDILKNKISKRMSKGSYNSSKNLQKQKSKKILGNKGELIVYNLLCQEYGTKNVFPRSEAFVELGLLKPGQAVSGQFDISYKDTNGNEFFVEVKTGERQAFTISVEELNFAKKNSEQYKLYLVYDIDLDEPKCTILPRKFWSNKKFRLSEVIERIEVNF